MAAGLKSPDNGSCCEVSAIGGDQSWTTSPSPASIIVANELFGSEGAVGALPIVSTDQNEGPAYLRN
jgi:hypothetical protein